MTDIIKTFLDIRASLPDANRSKSEFLFVTTDSPAFDRPAHAIEADADVLCCFVFKKVEGTAGAFKWICMDERLQSFIEENNHLALSTAYRCLS